MGDSLLPQIADNKGMGRFRVLIIAVVALMAVLPAQAFGAQMIARNAKWISLKAMNIEGTQVALVTYYAQGSTHHVLVWGAKNGAANPSVGSAPARFKINYSGGYGSFAKGTWQRISQHSGCTTYQGVGPKVHLAIKGCDLGGSFWLLQSWQGSELPDNGWAPADGKADSELWISHWDGPLATISMKTNWIYNNPRYDHVFGRVAYAGHNVYGASATGRGNPTDGFGRLVTIDTLKPAWTGGYKQPGGWYRYNSFLTHKGTGVYCDGIYPHIAGVKDRTVPGKGLSYRAIVNGPGVTPLIYWQSPAPGPYQSSIQQQRNLQLNTMQGPNGTCATTP
jgi:hypothetical protein